MALGWKRVAVTFTDDHDTMAGFLETENERGLLVNVQEPVTHKGFWFFPWDNIVSVYNVDSKKELAKRAKADAAKTTTKKELWDDNDGPG
jgi:hypothetical protein